MRHIPTVRPLWTYVILAVNVLFFAGMELSGGSTRSAVLIAFGANFAPLVERGEFFRLVVANFLHIGFLHFAVNSYSLYVVGARLENLIGHPRFVMLYLLTGISGAVFSFVFTHGLSAGASTSLFGAVGGLIAYFFRHRKALGEFGRQSLINMLGIVVINFVIGLSPGSAIDNFGHLGGLLGGLALGWFMAPRYEVSELAFGVYQGRKREVEPELDNGELMDVNGLNKQWLPILVFFVAMAAMVYARINLF